MYLSNTIDSLLDNNKCDFVRRQSYSNLLRSMKDTFKELKDTHFVIE